MLYIPYIVGRVSLSRFNAPNPPPQIDINLPLQKSARGYLQRGHDDTKTSEQSSGADLKRASSAGVLSRVAGRSSARSSALLLLRPRGSRGRGTSAGRATAGSATSLAAACASGRSGSRAGGDLRGCSRVSIQALCTCSSHPCTSSVEELKDGS